MLSQLTIRNFAIVDYLQIDWHPGLNVITGETGAGKSILIDAVGALLGDRLGPEIVRSGARGGARINGRGVPLSVIQELGELLVDVHGQSEHMALLRAREQIDYLDRYAVVLAERAQVARLVRELRAVREAHHRLIAEERE